MLNSQSNKLKSRQRANLSLMQTKPRKLLKLDLVNASNYNEFQGNSQCQIQQIKIDEQIDKIKSQNVLKQVARKNKFTYQEQVKQYQKFYQLISNKQIWVKKVGDTNKTKLDIQKKNNHINQGKQIQTQINNVKKQTKNNLKKQSNNILVKIQENIDMDNDEKNNIKETQNNSIMNNNNKQSKDKNIQKNKQQKSKPKQKPIPSSNWSKFLLESNFNKNINQHSKSNLLPSQQSSKFIAIDCQFVKCGQVQTLARISIVSQNGQTLYDSYIKPEQKITDYITSITGITYSHIKNAPFWKNQIKKVKKVLLNKIIVGHTIHKDLQVMKLNKWQGITKTIDIAQYLPYKQKNGSKTVSLKRLTTTLLNRNIQSGWHSSVEDAVATIDLFKLNKKKILKENNII